MRLKTIHIKNFRGCEDRNFNLHPQFNLVIGENGTGKTTFLEAAAIAIGSWLLGFPGHDSRSIRERDIRNVGDVIERRYRLLPQFPVRVSATGYIHVARASRNPDTREVEYVSLPKDLDPNPREAFIRWERAIESEGGKTTRRGANEIKRYASTMAMSVLSRQPRILPLIRYFGAGRLWESVRDTEGKALSKHKGKQPSELAEDADEIEKALQEYDKLSEPFYGYRMSVDKRCNPDDLLRWMKVENLTSQEEEGSQLALKMVYQAIESFLPEIRSARYSHTFKTLMLHFKSGERLPFSQLSDGYRNVVSIVADLTIKAVMLNPQLAEKALELTPGVVLIDELDLHLHPRWQQRIIADLRRIFPKVQFICTTHSPFIIQTLESGDELIDLSDGNGVGIDKLDNVGIEAISKGIMGVDAKASPSYMAMLDAAKGYLAELDDASNAPEERLEEYKRQLSERLAPFADNPAFQAVLEVERISKLGS